MRSHAKALFVVAALCSFFAFAGPASAFEFERFGAFAEQPADFAATHLGHLAVENSTSNLYVANAKADRIDVYSPTPRAATLLTSFGEGELEDPYGLAIDENGGQTYLYVADSGHGRILKYASDEAPTPSFTPDGSFALATGHIANFKVALAVDPTNHDLLVADPGTNEVERFDENGAFKPSSFDGNDPTSPSPQGAFAGLRDVAVEPDGDVVVIDQRENGEPYGTSYAYRFSPNGEYEFSFPVTQPGRAAVRANGEVVISGGQNSVAFGEPLTLQFFDPSGAETSKWTIPDEGQPGAFGGSPGLYSQVTGLATAVVGQRLYAATDVARELYYGAPSIQVYGVFSPVPPEVTSASAIGVTDQTAALRGAVNPVGLPTSYWFEYGPTDSYGADIPLAHDGEAGKGFDPVAVTRYVNGLAAGTTYHYRLVARNELGTTYGVDRTFTTAADMPEAPGSGRGYELVSPPDKRGIDMKASTWDIKASPDGKRVITIGYPLPGAPSAAAENVQLATRGASGWSMEDITPPYFPQSQLSIDPWFQAFSPDLSKVALFTSDPPLTPGAQAETGNLYIRDNDHGAASPYTLLTPSGPPGALLAGPTGYSVVASDTTADFSHVAFDSRWPMTPNAPAGQKSNVYEWVKGKGLRLASILPSGEPAQGAYSGATDEAAAVKGVTDSGFGEGTLSGDGSRLFFTTLSHHTDPGEEEFDRQIYARIDGTETIPVSASQRTDCADHDPCTGALEPDPNGGRPALFLGATPDGSKVFFRSKERLTDDAQNDVGMDLYMFDVATKELTDLSVSTSLPSGSGRLAGLIGFSDDGSRVYYAVDSGSEGASVYLWDQGEIRSVSPLKSSLQEQPEGCNWASSAIACGGPKQSRVSPDGRYLLLSSSKQLTSYPTQGLRELYLYDSATGEMRCASCNPSLLPEATAPASTIGGGAMGRYHGFETTTLAPGGRVVFETAQALLPRDTNNRIDVYLYDHGKLELISTGLGNDDAYLGDMTPSGSDVFFFTRAQLVAVDFDHSADLYDARVGGGIASQQVGAAKPSPCQGESCQPAPSPPNDPTPASMSFSGAGNVKASAKRGHHKKKHGKHRKAHRKHKKKTGAKQRAKKPSTHRNG